MKAEIYETSHLYMKRYMRGKDKYIDFFVLDASHFDILEDIGVTLAEEEFGTFFGIPNIPRYIDDFKAAKTEKEKDQVLYEVCLHAMIIVNCYC